MIKGIPENTHGLLDYVYVPVVFNSAKIFGFKNEHKADAYCKSLATSVLVYTLLTDARWGLVKLIPYKAHLALDLTSGVVSAAVPSLLGIKNKNARKVMMGLSITGLVVGMLSYIGDKNRK